MSSNQPTLFDPQTTEKPRCRHCGAAARNVCAHNADIERGEKEPLAKRPDGCIASAQLHRDEPLPF